MQQLPALPSLGWALLLLPLALLGWRFRPLLPLCFFVAGLSWVTLQSQLILKDHLAAELEGQDIWVEGFVADLPKQSEQGLRIEFAVSRASLAGKPVTVPHKIQLNVRDFQRLQVGDEWGWLVRLKRPHGTQNPGGFDYEGYLFRERIRATGYVRPNAAAQLISSDVFSYPLGRFRQYVGDGIQRALRDNAFSGVITAFANGDEGGVQDAQWDILQRTGTTHLIAISGMNIGLIAGIAFFFTRWLWAWPGVTVLRLPAQKAAALAAMGAALFYAALAGFAIPTQRALIMLAVVMGAILLQRSARPSQLLATALLLVLVYDPLAVMSAGFWLSFASVAVILLAIHGRLRESKWSQWGRMQWVVAMGLLPMMLALFQQTSLSGPLANMLAIPAIELAVIPLTLLGIFTLLILPQAVAALLFQFAAWIMSKLWIALEYFAAMEHTQWTQHAPLYWTLVCALFGLLLLLAPRGLPARWVGGVWLLPMLLIRPAGPTPGEVWFTLLDVGQGLAAVVRTQQHVLVFDTGARLSTRFDMGRAAVIPYLRASGVQTLDMLIVSHKDNDHIGGAPSLLGAFPAKHVLSSVPERLPQAAHCLAGQRWTWDGVDFAILNPANEAARGNNASCVLSVTNAYGRILLTGDIESAAEKALINRWGDKLGAKILIAPHHGSKTSSSTEFLQAVHPDLVLIPVGYRNRYRHPHPTVTQRYKEQGIASLASPQQGAITVELRANGMDVSGYRQTHQRYWFAPE